MIVLSGSNAQTTRYNDYNVKENNSIISLGFDCDKDGFIYAPNNNNNNIHLYSADSILICSSTLYNSIKVGVCYACTYVCVCMLVRYVYALKLI